VHACVTREESSDDAPAAKQKVIRALLTAVCSVLLVSETLAEQEPTPPEHVHAAMPASWTTMYDGVLFGTFSHQTGLRGGNEVLSTNWGMGMVTRQAGPGRLTLTGMVSVEPATVGPRGYKELFQVGETYRFLPLVDRQHPHDLFMQASVAWRIPLTDRTGLTFAGAPVGEATLGPAAFMHRPSAAENSVAPLSHHTLDSTHISMGVIAAAVDHGRWTFESSVFQSGEPDDNRWDFIDAGPLDSWAARVSYSPTPTWELQGSHGYLKNAERLEFAHMHRTTASASWFRPASGGFTAATIAFGRNAKQYHGTFYAALAEATHHQGRFSYYGRLEGVQVETLLLLSRGVFHSHERVPADLVTAGTVGGVIDVASWLGIETGVGAEITSYVVPDALRTAYGEHPMAFRVFLRIRPPVGSMGRMWNMRMTRPMH
jgi:hypothetical protein